MAKRVISAVVLIAIAFTCIFLSSISRVLFFCAGGLLCAYELSKNLERLDVHCTARIMFIYLPVNALLVLLNTGLLSYIACFAAAVYGALFSGILHSRISGNGALYTVFGIAYPCFPFALIMMISVSEIWLESILTACIATWICDSFALFGGMLFGKHKIAPAVSPNKTVEGCISGAVFASIAGIGVHYLSLLYNPIPLWLCVLTCFLASSSGQIGDLAESLLKRMIGIKDFSNLIPGHGGMFDRADSLLFSIPTVFICYYLAGI